MSVFASPRNFGGVSGSPTIFKAGVVRCTTRKTLDRSSGCTSGSCPAFSVAVTCFTSPVNCSRTLPGVPSSLMTPSVEATSCALSVIASLSWGAVSGSSVARSTEVRESTDDVSSSGTSSRLAFRAAVTSSTACFCSGGGSVPSSPPVVGPDVRSVGDVSLEPVVSVGVESSGAVVDGGVDGVEGGAVVGADGVADGVG